MVTSPQREVHFCMPQYLEQTALLNYGHSAITTLVAQKGWPALPEKERIRAIYDFVRDDIAFGYNERDAISAATVLQDGYGQCNTKGILFMALLRACSIPCRMHGSLIDKPLQRGALTGLFYQLAPNEILHSWVELFYDGRWLNLEGFILDKPYLYSLQQAFQDCTGSFCGYGVATDNFQSPQIDWAENDTYIQKEGIVKDLGVYDNPDALFAANKQALSPLQAFLYARVVRHSMNRAVRRIRNDRIL